MKNLVNKSIITLICIVAIIVSATQITIANPVCYEKDFKALKTFYESTNGDNWTNNSGWEVVKNNDTPPENCDLKNLKGITTWAGRVVRLQLSNNNLTGEIPNNIYFLDKLQILDLSANDIEGIIPNKIGYCSDLININLKSNKLTARIPFSIGFLENLTHLCLSNNNLNSVIPRQIGNCTKLIRVEFFDNELSGAIPTQIGRLHKMVTFDVCRNNLSGNIPVELGSCESLRYCRLNDNELIGGIPAEVGNIQNLRKFHVNDNQLEGCYPYNLRKICVTLDETSNSNYMVSKGNNFNESWEDFDRYFMGVCENRNKIDNNKSEAITIYPNPSNGFINVSYTNENLNTNTPTELSIYNSTGSEVFSQSINNQPTNNIQINVSQLAKGSYIVKINKAAEIYYEKLMIK